MEGKIFDENYAKYYDFFNEGKDYSKEVEFLESVFEKYSSGVNEVLDLACGTGIHAKHLASKGYKIVGIDLSEEMINVAKGKNILGVEFGVGNMKNFNLDRKFDACITMFAAIGYLTKNNEIESYLKSVKRHLKPGGLLILDCWNGLGVMHDLPSSRTKSVEKDNLKIVRTSFPTLDAVNHKCEVRFDVKVFENENLVRKYEERHDVRFFFPQELRKYLEDAGFEVVEICKLFELGGRVGEGDWNMSVVARVK